MTDCVPEDVTLIAALLFSASETLPSATREAGLGQSRLLRGGTRHGLDQPGFELAATNSHLVHSGTSVRPSVGRPSCTNNQSEVVWKAPFDFSQLGSFLSPGRPEVGPHATFMGLNAVRCSQLRNLIARDSGTRFMQDRQPHAEETP